MSTTAPTTRPAIARTLREYQLEAIDVSREDEYYPRFIHVCAVCNSPSSDTGGDDE